MSFRITPENLAYSDAQRRALDDWGEHVKVNYKPVHRLGHSALSTTAEIADLEEQFQKPAYDPETTSDNSS